MHNAPQHCGTRQSLPTALACFIAQGLAKSSFDVKRAPTEAGVGEGIIGIRPHVDETCCQNDACAKCLEHEEHAAARCSIRAYFPCTTET